MDSLMNSIVANLDKNKTNKEMLLSIESNLSELLIDTAPVIILLLSPQGKILVFNAFMQKLTGYSAEEVIGTDWFETFLLKSTIEETKKLFFSAINDSKTYSNKDYVMTKDGSQKTVEWHGKSIKDRDDKTIGLLSIGLDVTEREHAQNELIKSENQFRKLIESTNDWAWEIDINGLYTYVGPQVKALLGYTPQYLIGKSPFEFMPSDEAQRVKKIFKEIVKNRTNIVALKNANICKDGSIKILESSGVPFFSKNGTLLGYRGMDRDVTERERAEQSLRESEERFRSITASAQDAIIMIDNDGKTSYWNNAAENIFGYSKDEATGKMLHDFLAPKRFLEAHRKAFEQFKKTGEGLAVGQTLELFALKKDGTELPIELSLSKTMINGKWNAIGIIRDISERKKMQDELKLKDEMMIAQSKQAAMSDMIAMLAHQWRQPIAVISMAVNNLQVSIELEEEITTEVLKEHIETLHKQVMDLDKTISNFRDFFKPHQEKDELVSVKEILKSVLEIIGKSLENNNITLNVIATEEASFVVNKSSLIQVLLNILGNAKNILVNKKILEPVINLSISLSKDTIVISVCDNAGGIPDSIISKIDQPYFTTKEEFNGKGLGLYISRTIVEKHLFGTLTWHNERDGACFVITLKNKEPAVK